MKTKLAAKAFAAVALACTALAGCTKPGTAATVNGRPVSEQSVDELAQQLKENGLDRSLTASGVDISSRFRLLEFRVTITAVGPAVDKASEKLDASQKDQILQQCKKGLNASSDLPSDVQRYCLAQALTSGQPAFQKEISGILADMKVEYSKRYGVADKQKGLELPEYLTLRRR